jgi:hypothetical protein
MTDTYTEIENAIPSTRDPSPRFKSSLKREDRASLVIRNNISHNAVKRLSISLAMKRKLSSEGVQFATEVDVVRISKLRDSILDDVFYSASDIDWFRYQVCLDDQDF